MTVGRALEARTGFPLFHNHMTIELVLPFFEFGSPPFSRLVRSFREQLFREVAASQLPGLIFTWVWAFDEPDDEAYMSELVERFEAAGWRVVFAELQAELEIRLARNRTAFRLAEKPSKRDVDRSQERLLALDRRHRLRSGAHFPFPDHLAMDTTHMTAAEVAHRVADHFQLPDLLQETT